MMSFLSDNKLGKNSHPDHEIFKKRIRKSLKGQASNPSLPLTELAVDYLQKLAPRKLGKVDMYTASDICKSAYVSPCTLIMALMYAKRIEQQSKKGNKTENFKAHSIFCDNNNYLDNTFSSDLFLVSMIIASKILIDEGENDSITLEEWLRAAHFSEVEELHLLEKNFLRAIDWNLFVEKKDFYNFLSSIEKNVSWRELLKRGPSSSFTYSELDILTSAGEEVQNLNPLFAVFIIDIIKVLSTCCIVYSGLVFLSLACCSLNLSQETSFNLSPFFHNHHLSFLNAPPIIIFNSKKDTNNSDNKRISANHILAVDKKTSNESDIKSDLTSFPHLPFPLSSSCLAHF